MLTLAALLAGCGQSDRGALFPVAGRLTCNGQPLAGAQVVFHPQAPSDGKALPARGTTDAAGKFRLTTLVSDDGAAAGTYLVTVQYYPLVQWQDEFLAGTNILPPKYAAPATTDLKVEVSREMAEVPTLEIKR
jgi:hypothetical protein